MGHTGVCYDPGPSGTRCQVQGYVAILGLRGCGDLVVLGTMAHSINNCMVLGEHFRGSTEATRDVGVL